jgi:protocatechuate 3,4-dioxygenase beta subunit
MAPANGDEAVSRRGALKLLVLPVAALTAQKLLAACADEESNSVTDADTEPVVDASAPESDASVPDSGETIEGEASDIPWASGGTKAMQGGYPDPFAAGMVGTSCALTKAMILGPCYADALEREDISEGALGVPMRLSLLVVRADGCAPVAGATVDLWHASAAGVYSEFGPGTTCNPGSDDLVELKFCRGVQKTDAKGRVDFSSVVPGWYGGRAVHLHFTVRVDGDEYLTSQLFFDDALLDDIEQQADYEARGKRDTRNTQIRSSPRTIRIPTCWTPPSAPTVRSTHGR